MEQTRRMVLNVASFGTGQGITATLVLAMLAVSAGTAAGNAAPPWRRGHLVGEPRGVERVRIAKETLTLDLRPLENAAAAAIEAVYHLEAEANVGSVELVFVTGMRRVQDAKVSLDDRPIAWEVDAQGETPPEWLPPKTTPAFRNEAPLPYSAMTKVRPEELTLLRFTLNLSPGQYRLKVAYQAEASQYVRSDPTRYWQLAYILAPAKAWKSFGNLEVTLLTPGGWNVAATPHLDNVAAGVFRGHFEGIPADHIAVTIQAPFSSDPILSVGHWPGLIALVLGTLGTMGLAIATGFRAGVRRSHENHFWTFLVVRAFAVGLVTAFTVCIAYAWFTVGGSSGVPAGQGNWNQSYGSVMLAFVGVIFLAPTSFILAVVLNIGAVFLGRRQLKATGSAPPPNKP